MNKTISTVAVMAISMAVSVAAVGTSQERIPDVQRPGATDATSITLTGCVARGTANDSYTLTEEKKAAATATAPDAAPSTELVALSSTEVDISKHVGHKVAITGSYNDSDAVVGTTGAEKPAPSASPEKDKKAKTFTVKSLKMVAASC